jgi:sulfate adenylyltransferase subunit 2
MPHINRLNESQFLEKFVLFERSEFINFSLRKLKQSEEERFNWGVFFATFLHKQESRNTKNMRVFPISNWTELDIWQYIARENLELPPIYYSHKREVVRRKGLLVPVTPLTPKLPNEVSEVLDVRFRTVGDISCTCPVASTASTPLEIIEETAIADISERSATRLDDQASEAAMEKRKKEGYF